jgi:hypothetical protein
MAPHVEPKSSQGGISNLGFWRQTPTPDGVRQQTNARLAAGFFGNRGSRCVVAMRITRPACYKRPASEAIDQRQKRECSVPQRLATRGSTRIRKAQEHKPLLGQAQAASGCPRLCLPQITQPFRRIGAGARMGFAAISENDDDRRDVPSTRLRNQSAAAQRFIIRMRRQYHDRTIGKLRAKLLNG